MVYVTGDMHGEWERFKDKSIRRLRKGDTLIICGDFGFIWDDSRKEKQILKKMSMVLTHNIEILHNVLAYFLILMKKLLHILQFGVKGSKMTTILPKMNFYIYFLPLF